MRRIAVIGNSHVGALKEGWDAIAADHPETELRFFAVPKPAEAACRLAGLSYGLDERAAEPVRAQVRQINGGLALDLTDCDTVLYAGREFPFQNFRSLILDYDIDGLVELASAQRISAAAFRALSAPLFAPAVPEEPWQRLARSGRAVHLALKPMVSETVATQPPHPNLRFWKGWTEAPQRHAAYREALLTVFAEHLAAAGIGFLRQPPASLTGDGLTAERFSRGARRLLAGLAQPDNDLVHMNAAYGTLVLEAFFAEAHAPALA